MDAKVRRKYPGVSHPQLDPVLSTTPSRATFAQSFGRLAGREEVSQTTAPKSGDQMK